MGNIKIIIADDHTLFIDGLQLVLRDEPDISVEAIANDGKELLALLAVQNPDMVLLDINMPHFNGLECTKIISKSYPSIKILILSTYQDNHLIEKARILGAHGYLLKTTNKLELLQTIRHTAKGGTSFPVENHLPNEFDEADRFLKQFLLTKRELEILRLIKEGKTNSQIASVLFLSQFTVETHRKNIMQKLDLKSAASLHQFINQHKI